MSSLLRPSWPGTCIHHDAPLHVLLLYTIFWRQQPRPSACVILHVVNQEIDHNPADQLYEVVHTACTCVGPGWAYESARASYACVFSFQVRYKRTSDSRSTRCHKKSNIQYIEHKELATCTYTGECHKYGYARLQATTRREAGKGLLSRCTFQLRLSHATHLFAKPCKTRSSPVLHRRPSPK